MSLDHLERAARAAGFATALDVDDAPFTGELTDLKPVAAIRFKTPDAPAPRTSTALALMSEAHPSGARALVTNAVAQAIRSVQAMIGTRGAHA